MQRIPKNTKKQLLFTVTQLNTMNTTQLQKKVSFGFAGYGHNKVTIKFRGKEYKCTSTNTQATDRIKDDNEGINKDSYYTTKKAAYLSLYNEVKRANNLK